MSRNPFREAMGDEQAKVDEVWIGRQIGAAFYFGEILREGWGRYLIHTSWRLYRKYKEQA